MRGTTLANLLLMFKAEIGTELSAAIAPGGDSIYQTALANQQKWLVNTYDWPFMKKRLDIALVAATRYYAIPTVTLTDADGGNSVVDTLNFERPVDVKVKQNTIWITDPVDFGISEEQFQQTDSDTSTQLDPVTRWDFDNTTSSLRFEVWPIPQSAQTLRFVGQRPLNPLVADDDPADLDDLLIVYFTAAEFLARAKQGDAPAKLSKANARMNQLRGSSQSPNNRFILGGGTVTQTYTNRPRVFHD